MGSIMDRLKKNSRVDETAILQESQFFTEKKMVSTDVPMINVALSGELDGGLAAGFTLIAGDSKNFKSGYSLLMAAAYLKEHEDAVLLFYDSEFGSPQSYFESFGIDTSRVLHTPVKDVEELKFDIVNQLEEISRDDKVVIIIDSIGNLASKKELEDAKNEKSVADMSRAKALKGLFRMVTPYLNLRDIPMIGIAHTYDEMGLFPKKIVSGGKGIYYSADAIWMVGRSQDKQGTEIKGYHFNIVIEKSRHVREKSRIPISVSFDGGIKRHSGLLELAVESGHIKQSGAWYQIMDFDTGEIHDKKCRGDHIDPSFWKALVNDSIFKTYIRNKYKLVTGANLEAQDDESSED